MGAYGLPRGACQPCPPIGGCSATDLCHTLLWTGLAVPISSKGGALDVPHLDVRIGHGRAGIPAVAGGGFLALVRVIRRSRNQDRLTGFVLDIIPDSLQLSANRLAPGLAAVTAAGENWVKTGISPARQSTPGLLRRHTLESVVSRALELLQEHVTGAIKAGLYCWNRQLQGMSRLPLSELLEVSKNQDLPVFCG